MLTFYLWLFAFVLEPKISQNSKKIAIDILKILNKTKLKKPCPRLPLRDNKPCQIKTGKREIFGDLNYCLLPNLTIKNFQQTLNRYYLIN